MNPSQITDWCHEIIRSQVPEEGFYIDATMGKGKDTLLLCQMAGHNGKVLAFDVQGQALEQTRKLLEENHVADRASLILDGHEHMDQYAEEESADAICFNFGYLPGGDHSVATRKETSIPAVKKGLQLLRKGGVMVLCVYSGGDSGFEERDAVLNFAAGLNPKDYLVMKTDYYNRRNNPPIPVVIVKLH